jgi:hypothetical protein
LQLTNVREKVAGFCASAGEHGPDEPTLSEAIRRLVEIGLKAKGK